MGISAQATAGPQISVSVNVLPPNSGVGTLGGVIIVDEYTAWSERVIRWDGDKDTVRAAQIAAGLDPFSGTVLASYAVLSQRNAPAYVLTGRRDIGDASWSAALDAILSALSDLGETAVYLLTPVRTGSVQRTFASWATAHNMLAVLLTADAAVLANGLGSLEKLILADGSQAILVYHNAALASSAAPPAAVSTAGPWSIPAGSAMSVRQDTDEPETCIFDAAAARVVGSNDGPFAGTNGHHLDFQIDGAGVTYVAAVECAPPVLTASLSEPYALTDGQVIELEIGGVLKSWTVTAANYADETAATAAEMVLEANDVGALGTAATASDSGGVFIVTGAKQGNAQSMTVTANTDATWAAAVGFTIGQGALGSGNVADKSAITVAELVSMITVETGNTTIAQADALALALSGIRLGTGGKVTILASSTGAWLTALGFTAGTTDGTGDAADAGAVTRDELADLVGAEILEPTLTEQVGAGTVTLTGSNGSGLARTLLITGGLADAVGLAGEFTGEGTPDDYADAAWVGCRAGLDLSSAPPNAGPLPWDNVAPVGVYGERTLSNAVIARLINVQNVNVLVIVRPARGGEFHDGRLVKPYNNGQPAYADQWISARYLASACAAVCKEDFDRITDTGQKVSFFSTGAYEPFLRGSILRFQESAKVAGHIGQVDMEAPTSDKPTGVVITPKSALSPTLTGQRKARATVYLELAGALQGVLVEISLFAN